MKEVGQKITRLREAMPCSVCNRSIDQHSNKHPFTTLDIQTAADRASVSRETWRKLEVGDAIKLPTLVQIAESLRATPADMDELICTWLRCHAGTFSSRITIQPKSSQSPLRTSEDKLTSQLKSVVAKLNRREQQALLLAIGRPEVLNSITHLNSLYQSAQERKQERPKGTT